MPTQSRPRSHARSTTRSALAAVIGVALVASFGAAGVALLQCSNGTVGPSSPDASGASLRIAYDPSSARLRVTVGGTIDEATGVFAHARRGNLTPTSLAALDCNALAADPSARIDTTTPALPLDGSAPPSDAGGDQTFLGPAVDKSLLDQFFEVNVILGDPTPDQLAGFDAGVNSIVEGCILHAGNVVTKVQTSFFGAWDDATPGLLDRVQAMDVGGGGGAGSSGASPIHWVANYFQLCERELGPIPFFPKNADGSYATYDCVNGSYGVAVPVTITDDAGTVTNATTTVDACDRPDWLRSSCAAGTHVHRADGATGTRWVLVCRAPPASAVPGGHLFNDIALIGHDPVSGKTCFVQNALFAKNDGSRVPSPADPSLADTLWASYNASACNACHDADPWIHSPWVDQLKSSSGHYIVPRLGDDPAYPLGTKMPFIAVGMSAMQWQFKRQLTSPEAAACTACHRFAEGADMFGEGLDDPTQSWTARSLGMDSTFFQSVTPAYQSFLLSHSMPPDPKPAGFGPSTFPATDMGKAASFILGCAQANTCQWGPIPQ